MNDTPYESDEDLDVIETFGGGGCILIPEQAALEIEDAAEAAGMTAQDFLHDRLEALRERLEEAALLYGADGERRVLDELFGGPPTPPMPCRQFNMAFSGHVAQQWHKSPKRGDEFCGLRQLLLSDSLSPKVIGLKVFELIQARRFTLQQLQDELQWTEPSAEVCEQVLRHYRL